MCRSNSYLKKYLLKIAFFLTDIKVWHYLSVYRAQRLTNRDIINYFFFPLKLQDPQLIEVVPFFQCTELC